MAGEDWYLDSTEQRAHDGARQAGHNFYENRDYRGSAQPIFNQGMSLEEVNRFADQRAEPLRLELRELKKSLKAAEKAYEKKVAALVALQQKRQVTRRLLIGAVVLALVAGSFIGYRVSSAVGTSSGAPASSETASPFPTESSGLRADSSAGPADEDSLERVNVFLSDFDAAARNREFDNEARVKDFFAFPLTWYNWGPNDKRTRNAVSFARERRNAYSESEGKVAPCNSDPMEAEIIEADGADLDVDGYVRLKAGCGDRSGESIEVTLQLVHSDQGQPYRISCVWDETIGANDTCWSG